MLPGSQTRVSPSLCQALLKLNPLEHLPTVAIVPRDGDTYSSPWPGSSVGSWGTNLQKTLQNQVSPTTPTFPETTHLGTGLGDFTHLKVEARGTASLVRGCNTPVNTVCTCCGIITPTSNLGAVWNCNRAAVCHRGTEKGWNVPSLSISSEEKKWMRIEIPGRRLRNTTCWTMVSL